MRLPIYPFLALAILIGICVPSSPAAVPHEGKIMTVTGPIEPPDFGMVLPHEHIMVDFIGAEQVSPSRYDRQEVISTARVFLLEIVDQGFTGFVECTPAYIGRDATICKQLAEETGLYVLTNTGYYGAANDRCVPQHAYTESARQLAQRWISESRLGINGTGVFPGFIKTGVDSGPLSEIDAKLVRAAAIAHRKTGLPIAIHTGDDIACQQYLSIVKEEGVSLEAVIIVHAGNVKDTSILIDAAREGAWIELDNIAPNTIEEVINQVLILKSAGVLHKVMLSHDAGWYHVGEKNGGNFRPFTDLAKEGFPAMKKQGFTDREIRQLTQTNPQKAFTIGIHMRSAVN